MVEYSKYPNQIDTTTELPIATDLITGVKAEVVNRQRSAMVAIENELGIQPSSSFSTVKARLDDMDRRIRALEEAIANLELGTGGGGEVIASKIRVYRDTIQNGAAVNNPTTVIWDGTSSLVAAIRSSIDSTTISPTISGSYSIAGQLTFSPTVDSVKGIVIEVLNNSTVIHKVSDLGAVWGVGLERSINFQFLTDLEELDAISVRWTHSGSVLSTVDLVSGDILSWFTFSRVSGTT